MNEYYGITYASDFLSHHGVKGMHWGVRKMIDRRHQEHKAKRRYQNPDGSLKTKGIARVANSGSYLNPSRKGKDKRHTEHRTEVAKRYVSEFNARLPENRVHDDRTHPLQKEIWNKYKGDYASATLKDMGLKDSRSARRDVNKVFRDTDINYNMDAQDRLTRKGAKAYDRQAAQMAKRGKELAHPTKTKMKKAGKKAVKTAKSVLSTVATIKSLVK